MKFNLFINKVPTETKNILLKAIEIFHLLDNKNIICNSYDYENNAKQIFLNRGDKRCVSLFLASLLIETNVKIIMDNTKVSADFVFKYLNLNQENIECLKLSQYANVYNDVFSFLIEELKRYPNYNGIIISNDQLFPEVLVNYLAYIDILESDVINWIYKEANLLKYPYQCAYEHNSFIIVNRLMRKKLIKAASEKKNAPLAKGIDSKEKVSKSMLETYGDFLTDKKHLTNPAIGRKNEIKELMIKLLTLDKSPIIVGEARVGKTALVEGLSYLIYYNQVPNALQDMQIVKINTSSILSGCVCQGMFEERVEQIIEELIDNPSIILFIDEIHNVIGAGGSSEKPLDFANMLKPYLDRGQIKVIGATTNDEYEEYIMRDEAFKNRFEKIVVLEPNDKITYQILLETISKIENATLIKFDFNNQEKELLLEYIVKCTNKKYRTYNDNLNNPDLALSILKNSFAIAAFEDSEVVKLEYIADAIKFCTKLNESFRYRNAEIFITNFKNEPKKPNSNIIHFPNKNNNIIKKRS
ncbi:MAG: AAA family ATPase [Bacilli bacterium]|nr:AAA family ATPase [Bacilli bacterium]